MTLRLIAEDFIDPKQISKVLPLYAELITQTRKEPGCRAYELCRDLKQPGHFLFIEEWADDKALAEHVATAHFQRLVPLIDQYSIQASRFTHMTTVNCES